MIGYFLNDLWLSFTSIRTVYADELNLKKEQTSYSDLVDALRLVIIVITHHFCNTNINVIEAVGIAIAKIAKISPIPI
jgi:hypothetical protein